MATIVVATLLLFIKLPLRYAVFAIHYTVKLRRLISYTLLITNKIEQISGVLSTVVIWL